jgi:hypothetical protein
MLRKIRAKITWFYVVLFAALSGLGEGLHFLPGCGHAVAAGQGYLWMGATDPGTMLGLGDGVTRLQRPKKDHPPILATEQCPICQHFSFASSAAARVVFSAVSALVQDLSVPLCPELRPTTASSFQARAPPPV